MASKELLSIDHATGLRLFEELRRDPGENAVCLYSFEAARGLPEHLTPADPSDRVRALAAFTDIVAWLKQNPEPLSAPDGES